VVMHTHPTGPGLLAAILDRSSAMPVVNPVQHQRIARGTVYVAPPDRHLLLGSGYVRLDHGPKENHTRPAADPLFRSAATHYGERVIGVVLTGGDSDGTKGLTAIKRAGGIGIVQEPDEAHNPQMPRSALLHDHPDYRLPLAEIPPLLRDLASRPTKARALV
jgi:two-component system chemotaxis response regulator CheB